MNSDLSEFRGKRGMGSHQRPIEGERDEWLTPPAIIADLGPFDLDPCAATVPPWPTAKRMISLPADGLAEEWHGRVWLNPPYGRETWRWMERLAEHGDGIALTFARTETAGFFAQVWARADALLFVKGRLSFYRPGGELAHSNSGAPSVLIAYGMAAMRRLEQSSIPGAFVSDWRVNNVRTR